MKKLLAVLVTATLTGTALLAAQSASAASEYVCVDIQVQAGEETVFDGTVYTNGCTVTDSTDEEHTYEAATALCALDAAATQGDFTYEVINSQYGLYLNGVGDYSGDFTNYWSYYVDFVSAMVGLADYELTGGEQLLFTFGEFGATDPLRVSASRKQLFVGEIVTVYAEVYDSETGTFSPAPDGTSIMFGNYDKAIQDGEANFLTVEPGVNEVYAFSDSNTRSGSIIIKVFSKLSASTVTAKQRRKMVNKGHNYLLSELDTETGLVSESQSVTEWAAIAAGAAGDPGYSYYNAVVNYEPTVDDGAAEIARHILALEALGLDSRDVNGVNYVKRLKKTRSGKQYGSKELANDDIFAGLALLAADEPVRSRAVSQAVRGALNGKNKDGGVSYAVEATVSDVDTTAFFVQLLAATQNRPKAGKVKVGKQKNKAIRYLKRQQNLDGGWAYQRDTANEVESNSSSTAVAISAMKTARKKVTQYKKNNQTPFNYLNVIQRKNGAFKYNGDGDDSLETLNTAYAVIALSGAELPVRTEEVCSGDISATATQISCGADVIE